MNSIPEIIQQGIAIRNHYGYGEELREWAASLSEIEEEIIRLWESEWINPEEIEQAGKLFREIVAKSYLSTLDCPFEIRTKER